MGRNRSINHDLPPRVQRRVSQHTRRTWYYYKHPNGYREPLGSDYWVAIRKAEELAEQHDGTGVPRHVLRFAFAEFARDYLPTISRGTAYAYSRCLVRLGAVFGQVRFEDIKKADLTKYLDLSRAKIMAIRDIACLSSFWNWALATGRTEVPNPRLGMVFKRGIKIQKVPTHEEFLAVYNHGDQLLKDVMDVLYLTGQDVRVVLAWRRENIRGGYIDTTRSKTQHPLRIEITGDLKEVLHRCMSRESSFIISAPNGAPVTYDMVWKRFVAARKKAGVSFEIRALRRKTASEHESLTKAQELLGHGNTGITRKHYRLGEIVQPIKQRVK